MMRQAAIQSAEDLYGKNSREVQAVTKAYDAVGVQ
ncbi:M4 family metallopeptidase [Bacillus manliponensis]